VKRAREGRSATVRGRWNRVDVDQLQVPAREASPEELTIARSERAVLLEFAATLTESERLVLACKYGGQREVGRRVIARRLGLPVGEVRKCERSIKTKLARFALIVSAGTLCSHRDPAITALAAGTATTEQEAVARLHVLHCAPCRDAYAARLRAVHSGELERRLAELLPVPPAVRGGGSFRDVVSDWIARVLGSDATGTATHAAASGTGRGAGTIAMLKLAAVLCATGAGAACVQTGLVPNPLAGDDKAPLAREHRAGAPSASAGAARAPDSHRVAQPTATPEPTPTRPSRQRTSHGQTQGGTGPRSHEQAPASSAPADAAPNGGSEFNPTYQPSQPAKPAPVPAAPGSSEFF
jgi:hypothetical protein